MRTVLHLSEEARIDCDERQHMLVARDAALLAWLAIEGPTSRERLAALLWPASSAAQARTTLRQRLFQLRRQLGHELVSGTAVLRLADGVEHDLADGPGLLAELSLPDAPELERWLQTQREQRRQHELDALRAQFDALEAGGQLQAALSVARALLRLEPLSEAAHRRVVRMHYLLGDRAEALAAFDACERMLKDELSARPSHETMALLVVVQQAGPPVLAAAPPVLPAAVLRPPRLVGRARELAALQAAWAARYVAAIVGEAGIGKSRLLAEFAAARGGIVMAQARPADAGVPYASLARLLRELGQRHPADGLAPKERQQLARVLPELADPGSVQTEGARSDLQRALARYIAGTPGLDGILLDDLHFADAASLDMLQALLAEPDAVHWALAYRPAEAGTALRTVHDALADATRLQPVRLEPLDDARLAELVDHLQLGIDSRVIAPALHRRTGGNPLFALETLRQAWVDGEIGALQQDSPRLPRAASVERLLDRRLSQLGPAAQALMRVAAIAGVDFELGLAEAVLGTPALMLADALRAGGGAGVRRPALRPRPDAGRRIAQRARRAGRARARQGRSAPGGDRR